jgi:hypothetical protein
MAKFKNLLRLQSVWDIAPKNFRVPANVSSTILELIFVFNSFSYNNKEFDRKFVGAIFKNLLRLSSVWDIAPKNFRVPAKDRKKYFCF